MARAIAVVEDDESIREMLRYYFQSVGYNVRAYESGEAMFEAEAGKPGPVLYILDIMLPGMDGLEILRRLREGRETARCPSSCSPPAPPRWTGWPAWRTGRTTMWSSPSASWSSRPG